MISKKQPLPMFTTRDRRTFSIYYEKPLIFLSGARLSGGTTLFEWASPFLFPARNAGLRHTFVWGSKAGSIPSAQKLAPAASSLSASWHVLSLFITDEVIVRHTRDFVKRGFLICTPSLLLWIHIFFHMLNKDFCISKLLFRLSPARYIKVVIIRLFSA